MDDLWERHRATLEKAVETARTRTYWSPYPEAASTKVYGEAAKAEGEATFKAYQGATFPLGQPTNGELVGEETSPYGLALDIKYPAIDPDTAVAAARRGGKALQKLSLEARVGLLLEALARLNAKSFLMANAVMHTTGQSFPMAFQAAGPHAQDRGLEAVAYAYEEMIRIPGASRWEKPQGRGATAVLDKTFQIVPRGVGLVIGCATFPTWNSYGAIFANLATCNGVIVKPHPKAILPLAITVTTIREVLQEAGADPNAILLAADDPERPVTMAYIDHPGVDLIDFTGSPTFGAAVRAAANGRPVFTEEAGINPIVVTGTDDFEGMCGNIAFSLCLYSGQMCTAPQNIFVPKDGIDTNEGHKSFDEVAAGIGRAVDKLTADPDRAMGILGAIQNPAILERIEACRALGRVVRDSAPVTGTPLADGARTATPLILAVDAADEAAYMEERFGPIAFVVACPDAGDAIERAAASVKAKGAITASLYATDEAIVERAAAAFAEVGAPLSVNLTGNILVNQSAAFSDYHVSGMNPAGNASLTDAAYVASRFRVATVRRQAA